MQPYPRLRLPRLVPQLQRSPDLAKIAVLSSAA